MTREEAIKIIEYTFLNADGHLKPLSFDYGGGKGIVEALRMAIEALSQPSIPTNLDEAMIPESEMVEWMKYGPHTNYPWCDIPDAIKITAEHFFALGKQAGAEWMAGQGVIIEGRIAEGHREGYPALCLPTNMDNRYSAFKPGDKVVVQIRKK